MPRLAIWNRIPDNSTLNLSMNPNVGNFDVSAKVLREDGQTNSFNHQQIASGVAQISLAKPHMYTVTLTVRFVGQQSTVTLKAQVEKPGGGTHGTPFSESISGNNGRVEEAVLLAVTRK
jgi:hypothetical protein